MRLVLSGYYGFRNSGDEAVLKSILTALEQAGRERGVAVEPVVLSADPAWTSRQYGVEAVPRMKLGQVVRALRGSDGLISGGGSLLQDATGAGSIPYYLGIMELARWSGKPVFVYAQGIGPVNRAMFRWPIARAFRKAAYVSVRDEESAALLRRFGVPAARIDVVPDPVMGLPMPPATPAPASAAAPAPTTAPAAAPAPTTASAAVTAPAPAPTTAPAPAAALAFAPAPAAAAADKDTPPTVGVSVRFWRSDRADLDRVAAALAVLAARRPVRLRFLPFHHGPDEDASRYVMERISAAAPSGTPAELAPAHEDPQQMLREVAGCRLLIGMRLHSLIYAANRGIPLLGLSYDPKIDQFLHQLGQTAVGTTDSLDPDIFADQAVRLLDDPVQWTTVVHPFIERLKQMAIQPAQQILSYARI